MSIIEDRLALLESISLDHGRHRSFDDGMCAMEAAAWLAGEEWSDHPNCVSPVIGQFLRSWNDTLGDEARNTLIKPLIPLTIGTRTTKRDETTRAWMCTDWLAREQAPAWLRLAGLTENATLLEQLAPLKGAASARKAQPSLDKARKAGDAARAAAWDAAGAAAWDAAGAAAGAAAGDAAGDAARDAAWAAARDAAGAYSDAVLGKDPDLVLIDGRFRVACCLKCPAKVPILFDDFLGRPQYHSVLDYFQIVEQVGRMVVLNKTAPVPPDIVAKYELIAD